MPADEIPAAGRPLKCLAVACHLPYIEISDHGLRLHPPVPVRIDRPGVAVIFIYHSAAINISFGCRLRYPDAQRAEPVPDIVIPYDPGRLPEKPGSLYIVAV